MAIEEGELLLPVGGIVGRIEVDRDAPGPAPEPRAMVLDDQVGQPEAGQIELLPPHRVLEPGERRLGRQIRPREGIALEQELVHRVLGQARGVVAVGVAAGDPIDALPHQLDHLVLDLAGLPVVDQTGRQPLGDPQAVVQHLEQHRPAIRARVGLVESGDDRLPKPLDIEGHLRYTLCSHRASSQVCIETSSHRFYSTNEGLGGCSLSSFTHKVG